MKAFFIGLSKLPTNFQRQFRKKPYIYTTSTDNTCFDGLVEE